MAGRATLPNREAAAQDDDGRVERETKLTSHPEPEAGWLVTQ